MYRLLPIIMIITTALPAHADVMEKYIDNARSSRAHSSDYQTQQYNNQQYNNAGQATYQAPKPYSRPQNIATPSQFFFKPYVGASYQHMHLIDAGRLLESNLHGASVHVGARIHKHFGLEASYMHTDSADKTNLLGTGVNSELEFDGFTVDAMGYYPVDGHEDVELIGTLGLTYYRSDLELTGPISLRADGDEIGGRVGGGLQYWFNDHVNIRGLVRYQAWDISDLGETNSVVTTIGLNYQY